jgi:hypothetical protein
MKVESPCTNRGAGDILGSQHYIGWSGGRSRLPSKPFATNFHIKTPKGFVVLNGDQIATLEVMENGDNWDVIFHMADGTKYTVGANTWTQRFVSEFLDSLLSDSKNE